MQRLLPSSNPANSSLLYLHNPTTRATSDQRPPQDAPPSHLTPGAPCCSHPLSVAELETSVAQLLRHAKSYTRTSRSCCRRLAAARAPPKSSQFLCLAARRAWTPTAPSSSAPRPARHTTPHHAPLFLPAQHPLRYSLTRGKVLGETEADTGLGISRMPLALGLLSPSCSCSWRLHPAQPYSS